MVLAAAQPNQHALDAGFTGLTADTSLSGLDAGVFTYFLTRFLWQETATPESAIARVTSSLQQDGFAQAPLVDPQASPDS